MNTMHYLSIIRKADFIDLFKYGHLNIYSAVKFDGDITAHANDNNLFDGLTSSVNFFDYSFEYIIVHFTSENSDNHIFSVNIENVKGLYTFDEEAKKEMSISFDDRIKLYVSPWSNKFTKLRQMQQITQSKRGIDNLWAIFKLSENDRKKCESIITKDIVSEVFDELFAYRRPTGEQSIWTYLLRYERHSFYPKNTKGYFFDLMHVTCNWIAKKEILKDVANETRLCQQIKDSSETHFTPLFQIAQHSDLPSRTDGEAKCQFAIVAPLFLYLKNRFSNGFTIDQKIIEHIKRYGFEGSVIVYLLGLTLGYDKTYSAYYDFIRLPIFGPDKKKPEIEMTNIDLAHEPLPNEAIVNEQIKEATSKVLPSNENLEDRHNKSMSQVVEDKPQKQTSLVQEGVMEFNIDQVHEPLSNDVMQDEQIKGSTLSVLPSNEKIEDKQSISQGPDDKLQEQIVLTHQKGYTATDDSYKKKKPIVWLRPKSKTGMALKPAFSNDDISELEKNGYKIIRKYKKDEKAYIREQGYDI